MAFTNYDNHMTRATVITIGDEILIGQTIDTNSSWIGARLQERGIELIEIISVRDKADAIISAMERAGEQADWILITGGLGPTHDDITKMTLANYFGDTLAFNQEVYDRIVRLFERFGRVPTDAHRNQCYLPTRAEILENKKGTAPGMLFSWGERKVVSMPGVPYEMKYIMENSVLPLMNEHHHQIIISETVRTFGLGEGYVAERIEGIIENLPDGMSMAFLPSVGHVRVRVMARGTERQLLENLVTQAVGQIEELLGHYVYGRNEDSLEELVGSLLLERNMTLGTAESCTGGTIASKIVSIPGSSAYFVGSVVSYSNEVKMKTLGVPEQVLVNNGAVSEETVCHMVAGANRLLDSSVALAVSGIAGPGGGTEDKPVGTFWVACGTRDRIVAKQINITKDRSFNIQFVSDYALNMLRLFLMGVE